MFGKSMFRQGVILGEERGEKRGEARGRVRGRSESMYEAADWYRRKTNAEARGEPFDEPPPWERNTNGVARTDTGDEPPFDQHR